MKTILVTGSAGFIGSNLVLRLFKEMQEGTIVGLDNLNDYYDPTLKDYRLSVIEKAKLRSARRVRMDCLFRRMRCITSVVVSLRTCWIL